MRKTLLMLTALGAILLAPLGLQQPLAQSASVAPAASARVIVKYKADSSLLRRQALSADAARLSQAQALGQRLGLALRAGHAVTERSHVVFGSGLSSAQLASRLAAMADVEYAVPDVRRRRVDVPNDPLYGAGPPLAPAGLPTVGGPVVGQWYLRAPAGAVKSSINIEPAWDLSTGLPSMVVAVLDTGVRFDHPDLKRLSAGGNLLDGYDMIGDAAVGNDGNSTRDADASDPGDWITEAEANQVGGDYYQCTTFDTDTNRWVAENSSWHGTQVAGVVAAGTDNGIGMAGVARGVKLLPVRVLGKCGGFDSDIIAGMQWAAGIDVPGVPHNANPARVINLSLGSAGSCSSAYQDAIAGVSALGVVIVASAGNSSGHSVQVPANCPGVIGVAGLRHVGSKVGFSDVGPEISLSAPAGNCVDVDPGDACLYPILTLANLGLTTPVSNAAGGSIYTDSFNVSLGTSFSAPLVAGSAALMLSVQPGLTPSEVRSKLRSSTRAFPTTGADNGDDPAPVTQCVAPHSDASGNPVDQAQCYCTTSTCGAGMLDAGKALNSAAGVQARISVDSAEPTAGMALTLSASGSLLTSGRSISNYLWQVTDSGGIVTSFTGATDGATAFITPAAAGRFTVKLTATDNSGVVSSASQSIDVVAATVTPPPTGGGGGGGGALGAGWLLLLAAAVAALLVERLSGRRRRL